ncbi:MAG: hypothetical protein D6680_17655 [Cyanobacteria bacterium J007]|nr:MAG: hypothetical protein D6680_17655 [Cyanobacteria bacterium J007]
MEILALFHSYNAYEAVGGSLEGGAIEMRPLRMATLTMAVGLSVATLAPQASQAVVRRGDRGTAVRAVQEALVAQGHDPGKIDGVFGGATQYAVEQFQRRKNLPVDGTVGPLTGYALDLIEPKDPNNPYLIGNRPPQPKLPAVRPGRIRVETAGSRLNVRSGPGFNYGVVDRVWDGAEVATSGRRADGWIELANGGWVAANWTVALTAGGGGGGGNDPDPSPVAGEAIVSTNGSPLNVRATPGGPVLFMAANGSRLVLSGQRQGGWVELQGGGWVSQSWIREG